MHIIVFTSSQYSSTSLSAQFRPSQPLPSIFLYPRQGSSKYFLTSSSQSVFGLPFGPFEMGLQACICFDHSCILQFSLFINTGMPRLTKIIRSGITFVSRNLRQPKRDFPQVSIENRLIRSGCYPLFKDKFYKIVKSTLEKGKNLPKVQMNSYPIG